MLRPSPGRLLLLLPTATYRATAFVEAARRLGVELTVASELPSTFEQVQPAGLVTLDFSDPERAAQQAAEFARRHPIAGVIGVDDDGAVVAAAIAERLALKGNPPAAALAARDKHLQRRELARHGVPVPRFELHNVDEDVTQLAARVHYPCVLKPLRLAASRGVIRADDAPGFGAALERLRTILEQAGCERSILVEDFVPGPEVALEGLVIDGRLEVLGLFDKPDPLDGPFFEETIDVTPSRLPTPAQQALVACGEAAVAALGVREGPIHAELRHNARGPWLIELAARPIGGRCSAALRFTAGETGRENGLASLEELIIRHALGMPLPALEREERAAGVMMIPVPGAGVLREVRGIAEARAVPLVEEGEAPDVLDAFRGHFDAHQLDAGPREAGADAQVGVLVGGEELARHRRRGVLHVQAALPQHLHRPYDPAPPEARRPLDVSAVEERRVECEHAALVQDFANLRHDLRFVWNKMDRVEEHHRVGRRHQTRHPLRASLHELHDLGVNRRTGLGERGRRRVDPDHHGVAAVIEPFQDQLCHSPRPAPQVDDLASSRADHSLHNPAVDLGEERMPRERFKREAFRFIYGATDHATSASYSLWIASGLKCTSRL